MTDFVKLSTTGCGEDELLRRASRAYFRRFGKDAEMPCNDIKWLSHRVFALYNVRGNLAAYHWSDAANRLEYVDLALNGHLTGGER